MSEKVEERTGGVDQIPAQTGPLFERITRDPPKEEKTTGKKVKDPKKVSAGKKLAEYNKKAKEALAREMEREKEQERNKNEEENTQSSESKPWLPELSFTTVLSIIGIGFTAFDMFMRYRTVRSEGLTVSKEDDKNRESKTLPSNIPIPTGGRNPQPQPQKSVGPTPLKIGML